MTCDPLCTCVGVMWLMSSDGSCLSGLPTVVQTQQQNPHLLIRCAFQLTQDGQQSLQQVVRGDRGSPAAAISCVTGSSDHPAASSPAGRTTQTSFLELAAGLLTEAMIEDNGPRMKQGRPDLVEELLRCMDG